jgi:hypothetical protein
VATTSSFSTLNGQIIGPNGEPFIARGIDITDFELSSAITGPTVDPLLGLFPGLNFIRLAVTNYAGDSLSSLEQEINWATSKGVVVEVEDHNYPTPLSGSSLTSVEGFYSSLASAFNNDPYVWFGTQNEPDSGNPNDESAVTNEQVGIYNAVRSVGNTSPILIDAVGAYSTTGLSPSTYASMTNIIWDAHYYDWLSGYSSNQPTVTAALNNEVSSLQSFATGANGTIPVIIGEYGNSTNGSSIDPGWQQVVAAVDASGRGSAAWTWYFPDATGDELTDGNGHLTAYGQLVANYINSAPPPPPPSGGSAGGSPSGTVITPGSGSFTDSAGNVYTLSAQDVATENGAPIPGGAGTAEMEYFNGLVYGEDATSHQWYSWNGSNWLAAVAPPSGGGGGSSGGGTTPSPNDAIVLAGASGSLIDSSGNVWTITSVDTVDENGRAAGYTANVAEIAYVNNVIWHENDSEQWYAWNGSGWTSGADPLPTSSGGGGGPTPSPNDTVVLAGSTATITDASGNTWTIVNHIVDENGNPAGYTANVAEIAYVAGVVWHENTSSQWYSWTGSGWKAGTDPLPSSDPAPTLSSSDAVGMTGPTAGAAVPDLTITSDTLINSSDGMNQQTFDLTGNGIHVVVSGLTDNMVLIRSNADTVLLDNDNVENVYDNGLGTNIMAASTQGIDIYDFQNDPGGTFTAMFASTLALQASMRSDGSGGTFVGTGPNTVDFIGDANLQPSQLHGVVPR